jgi:membrane protein implicated in regulation of membrane protease activity
MEELWDVMSEEPLRAGERVKAVAVTGITAKVEKAGGA